MASRKAKLFFFLEFFFLVSQSLKIAKKCQQVPEKSAQKAHKVPKGALNKKRL